MVHSGLLASRKVKLPSDFTDVTLACEDVLQFEAHKVILKSGMAPSNYGELRQLFETFTRVWKAGGQTSLHLHTQDGQARAMLDIQLGPPGDPRPGAPDVRGKGPSGQDHGPQYYHPPQHPRKPGGINWPLGKREKKALCMPFF